jgi:hypothetical protein
MPEKKTKLQDAAYGWIKRLPRDSEFRNADVYSFLEKRFPAECRQRGDAKSEPRYKNDGRWAVEKALGKKGSEHRIAERIARGHFRRL